MGGTCNTLIVFLSDNSIPIALVIGGRLSTPALDLRHRLPVAVVNEPLTLATINYGDHIHIHCTSSDVVEGKLDRDDLSVDITLYKLRYANRKVSSCYRKKQSPII